VTVTVIRATDSADGTAEPRWVPNRAPARRPSPSGIWDDDAVKYAEHIADLVGGTPLVRLTSVTQGLAPTVLAKVEYLNPGGSVKDRIALRMVEAAERSGELRPGGTIVEPTSGNTGVGLALVAQRKGYSCVFVCPDKVGQDKINVLTAYGARVVVTPTAVPPDHPDSYYSVSDRLVGEIDGAWKPNQYANPEGPASHYATTGPEIWADTEGRVTHFVAGVGTGGTITGTGRYLKDVSADRASGPVTIIGADPEGSVYSGGTGRPYLVEGVGEDFWPPAYDPSVPDRIVAVSDGDSFEMTRRLAREEGLLVGGSCGMAVVAALEVARELGPDDVLVVLLPDGGRGYLGKIFNDDWMSSFGFLRVAGELTVGDVLHAKSGALPALVHTHPSETVRDAVQILREYGVSQMPVVKAEPPVMAGEVAGSVSERDLLDALFTGKAHLADSVGRHMGPSLPHVGAGEPVTVARQELQRADALLVIEDGKPIGVLTRADLLSFLAD
jgi:cystathionine beta-synthase